jgi:HEAT repeat protein
MAIDLPQLLQKSPTAYNLADWSALIEYLQNDSETAKNQPHLRELVFLGFYWGDFQQRWEIGKILISWGKIAIPLLIEILEDEEAEEELRWYAVRILGELHYPEAVQPLVDLLNQSENEELQAIAAAALGQMGTIAITALTQLLQQEETKLLAVRSLSQIRHKETITALLTVVNDKNPTIRNLAIEALSSFHDARVPPILLPAINDVAATVRKVAILGLGFRPELQPEFDLVHQLQPRLLDSNLEVCCATVTALSRLGGDAVADCLFPVLISPSTPVILQLEIVRALSWMGTTSGLKYLQTAFFHSLSPTVWQEMVIVLGRVKQSDLTVLATDILLELLENKHPATEINIVKSAIALSLGHLRMPKAIPALTLLLNESEPQVKLHAKAALKGLGCISH